MGPDKQTLLKRREALKKLAKLSAYSAPTVTVLLSSSLSHAQGSGVPATQCISNNGRFLSNRSKNHRRFVNNAADEGGNVSGANLPNTNSDCGVAGNTAN